MLQNDIICHANAFCAKCNTDSGNPLKPSNKP